MALVILISEGGEGRKERSKKISSKQWGVQSNKMQGETGVKWTKSHPELVGELRSLDRRLGFKAQSW